MNAKPFGIKWKFELPFFETTKIDNKNFNIGESNKLNKFPAFYFI